MFFRKMFTSLAKDNFKPVRNLIHRSSLIFFLTGWDIVCIYGIYLRSVYLQSFGSHVIAQKPDGISIDILAIILFLASVCPWFITKDYS